jgi:hypothetical protein
MLYKHATTVHFHIELVVHRIFGYANGQRSGQGADLY